MREIEVTVGKVEDILALDLRREDEEVMRDRENRARQLCSQGPTYALRHKGQLLACCGMANFWPGMAEIWILCDQAVRGFGREILSMCRYLVEHHIETDRLWRMQALCRADWLEANNFLRRLGFRREARLPCYGPNSHVDYNLWARVRRWS